MATLNGWFFFQVYINFIVIKFLNCKIKNWDCDILSKDVGNYRMLLYQLQFKYT